MIIIIFRIRKVIKGTKVNVKKTIIFSAYFLAITSFFVYNSFLIGRFPIAYVAPYFAIAVGAAYCSYWYSKKTLSFQKVPNGNASSISFTIYAKGGLSIYLIYTVALTIRIVINFLFIGSEKFFFNNQESLLANNTAIAVLPLLSTDAATTTLALVVTDTLLIIGAGLLLGRNARILKYLYKEKQSEVEK